MKNLIAFLPALLLTLIAAAPNPCWHNSYNITPEQKAHPCEAFEEMLPAYKALADGHLAVIDQIVAIGRLEHAMKIEYSFRRDEAAKPSAITTDKSYYFESNRRRDLNAANAVLTARDLRIANLEKQRDALVEKLKLVATFPIEKVSFSLDDGHDIPVAAQKFYFRETCYLSNSTQYGQYLDEDIVFKLTHTKPGVVTYNDEQNPLCHYLTVPLYVQYSRADRFRAECNRSIEAKAEAEKSARVATLQNKLRTIVNVPAK